MAKQALILIDIQNDYFPQGKWPLDGVDAAADKAAQVLQAFRQAGDTVIHVRTLGARREERRVLGGELMTHMNHRITRQYPWPSKHSS